MSKIGFQCKQEGLILSPPVRKEAQLTLLGKTQQYKSSYRTIPDSSRFPDHLYETSGTKKGMLKLYKLPSWGKEEL